MSSAERWFTPWDRAAAHRAGLVLMLFASAVTGVDLAVVTPQDEFARIAGYAFPATFLVATVVLHRVGPVLPDLMYALLPLSGTSMTMLLCYVRHDASASMQLLLVLPLLYSSTQLRPPAAALMLLAAVGAEAEIVGTMLPAETAVRDCAYFAAVGTLMTVLLVRGSTAQRELADVLRHQASVDSLTGLVNRRVLDEAARSAIAGARGHEGTALILFDIDHFKSINDTHGHPVGDAVLTYVAATVRAHTRPDSVIARIGGDEIALLLPGCSSEVALRRARAIVEAIHTSPLVLADGTDVPLSVSAGLAHAPDDSGDLAEIYAAADAALYDAKRGGRNRVSTTGA